MRQIKHPQLEVISEIESLDLQFAREAFELVSLYGEIEEFALTPKDRVNCLVTGRQDIDGPNNTQIAMRLRALPSVEWPNTGPLREVEPPEHRAPNEIPGILAILFEYCELPKDWPTQYPLGEKLPWKDYVASLINVEDIDVPLLIDATSGDELTEQDSFTALAALRELREALRLDCYETDADEVGLGFAKVPKSTTFEPGEFIKGYGCDECGSSYTHCAHKLNVGSSN